MKKWYFLIIAISFTVIAYKSCSFSDSELYKGWWKYSSGQYAGDLFRLNANNLKNDTIYHGNQPVAIIVDKEGSYFGITSKKILIKTLIPSITHIESVQDKSLGVYVQK